MIASRWILSSLMSLAAVALVSLTPATAAPKVAITGLAASHDIKREGSRLCFSDHYHYGSSAGLANKKKAEAEAISSWANFVDFEYGSTWANFRKASSKGMNCSQSSSGWGCELSARPCI